MSAPLFDLYDDEQVKLVDWRKDELRRVGFERNDAHSMAVRRDVDVKQVLAMIAAGCAHRVAMDIVL